MKSKKVKLHQLEVQSFVTELDGRRLKGGDNQGQNQGPQQLPGTAHVCSGSGSPC